MSENGIEIIELGISCICLSVELNKLKSRHFLRHLI